MKRTALRRRTPLRRGRRRLGQAARERVAAGGVLAKGRVAASLEAWRACVGRVLDRAHGRCERCGSRKALDPHHVLKRSAGGGDDDANVIALCRWTCHRLCDVSYRDGRLVVAPLGAGHFCFRRVWATHKGAAPWRVEHEHTPTAAWLAAQGRPTTGRRDVSGCPAAPEVEEIP